MPVIKLAFTYICLTLLSSQFGYSQELSPYNVIGVVLDEEEHLPVGEAFVYLVNVNEESLDSVSTKPDGNFQFELVKDQAYKLFSSKEKMVSDVKYLNTFDIGETKIFSNILILNDSPTRLVTNVAVETTTDAWMEELDEIEFSIYVGRFIDKLPTQSSFVKSLGDIYEVTRSDDGKFSYRSGKFDDLELALAHQSFLKNMGHISAKVIVLQAGELLEVDPKEIMEILKVKRMKKAK